jgi:hypothetical protein
MLRSLCVVIGLGSLGLGPALADVIDVTVNGTGSGYGSGTIICPALPLSPTGCFQPPTGPPLLNLSFSFSETNTQLGTFAASGTASGPDGIGQISAYADQNTTATAESLFIQLSGGYTVLGLTYYDASEQDTIAVSFDLTEASEIQLFGIILQGVGSNSGELLDSDGNVILTLPFADGSASTVLQPGTYQLDESVGGSSTGSFASNVTGTNLNYLMDATFTPVPTPEPRGVLLAALLATMLGGYVVSRRRRVS